MDAKTLEYMQVRVDKGNELQKKISDMQTFIKKMDDCNTMDVSVNYCNYRLSGRLSEDEIYKRLHDAVLKVCNDCIAEWQKEFVEL